MVTTDYTQTASPFIEAAGKNYLNELTSAIGDFKATDLSGIMGRQFIAGADPLSTQAEALAPGLAGYQPFLTQAQQLASPTAYQTYICLLYTSPSPRDRQKSRMPSSA